jgi:hypothetical protein
MVSSLSILLTIAVFPRYDPYWHMTYRSKIIVTLLLLIFLGGLGIADMYFSREEMAANMPQPPEGTMQDPLTNNPSQPGQGVAKRQTGTINDTLIELGYTVQPTDERSMLEQVVDTTTTPVNTLTILKDGDRVGAIVSLQSPDVKTYFASLKEALLAAFSPDVKDLEDVTRVDPGLPIRNELTFLDPKLSEERLYFMRSREMLVEGHAVVGKEEEMRKILDGLGAL